MKINESVVSGDIASLCGYGMSPLALSASSIQPSIQPSVTGAVPIKTAAINKRAPRAQKIFKTVDADGSIFGHYVRPSFNTTTLQWESPKRALLGVAQFSQDVDPIKMAALSIIETAESDINSKETFIRSGYFDAIKLFESKENPNLMEGAHFRSIYFSKNYEFEIPSIFRFAAIDDSGDVNIFTSRPNYLTTGCWSGKGQTLIANAKWSENYAFPIIASNLLLKLFGQSRLDSIAPKVMVSSWEIFENALDKMWEDYELTYDNALPYRRQIAVTASHIRIDELKKAIRALGDVNIAAIDDYKSVKERYDEMSAQYADLTAAKADLSQLIDELTRTMEN